LIRIAGASGCKNAGTIVLLLMQAFVGFEQPRSREPRP
jgi:hypothetical protein